ncbi:type I-C CRISPR-associated protein Cas5c [Terriglobus albidus]|uniref:type I-C CRISPR-associated protein Cas5c n=1 Tax=Terriglobus albidus TaxID=1592106 RepID=UPI0021DF4AE2|nr:type I-C CRISPR-associated protein Cas5c [Terriglobus albidus]
MFSRNFFIRIQGPFACFTRPEFSAERVTYDLITPSAARGILEAVLWKPAICWEIQRISLLRPIRYIRICRNEVSSRLSTAKALSAAVGDKAMPDFYADEDRTQRNTVALRDVAYGIAARFRMTRRAGPRDNIRKFEEMFERRLQKGQQCYQPYLGCREFPASVEPWDGGGVLESESRMLGWMLHDLVFGVDGKTEPVNQPRFFVAELRCGVLEVPAWEEVKPTIPETSHQ